MLLRVASRRRQVERSGPCLPRFGVGFGCFRTGLVALVPGSCAHHIAA